VKRDFELIRNLLLECEKSTERWFTVGVLESGEWEPTLKTKLNEQQLLQIDLMAEAGLLRKENVSHPGLAGPEVAEVMYELTWAGYDYLDAVRDEGVWEKTKSAVIETGGSATLEIVKSVGIGFLKAKIEKHTGVKL
jgi:hypothetical protein